MHSFKTLTKHSFFDNLIFFLILKSKVKDAHKILRRKHVSNTIYENLRTDY